VGGGALIVAIAAYYLYFVKPKTRDVEDARIVAPAASFRYTPPLVTLVLERKEQPASNKDEATVKPAKIEVSVTPMLSGTGYDRYARRVCVCGRERV
jgi:hypothetical protein